jgi:hypothetical protein
MRRRRLPAVSRSLTTVEALRARVISGAQLLDLLVGASPGRRWRSYREFLRTYELVRVALLARWRSRRYKGRRTPFAETLYRAARRFRGVDIEVLGARLHERKFGPSRQRLVDRHRGGVRGDEG